MIKYCEPSANLGELSGYFLPQRTQRKIII